MLLEEFVLSPLCRFIAVEEITVDQLDDFTDLQKIKNKELFLLYNALDNRTLVVNPSIHSFLTAFQQPTNLKTVTEQYAEQFQCHPTEIVDKLADFLEDMLDNDLIVEVDGVEELQAEYERLETPTLTIGQLFEGYEIIESIAIKRSVEIYLAKEKDAEKKVIIKLLRIDESLDEEDIEWDKQEFEQEFMILQKFQDNPNICQLYTLSMTTSPPFAVMEYIEGQSLKGRITATETLNLQERLQLIGQLVKIVASIHEKGIVHGDLQYHNLLVTKDLTLKAIDFGLANHAEVDSEEIERNGGIIHFIPPERIEENVFSFSKEQANFQAEIFQIAIIAYFILYGELPFQGFTRKAVMQAIQEDTPAFPEQIDGEKIPTFIIKFLQKSLDKNPENRFINGMDMWRNWEKENLLITN